MAAVDELATLVFHEQQIAERALVETFVANQQARPVDQANAPELKLHFVFEVILLQEDLTQQGAADLAGAEDCIMHVALALRRQRAQLLEAKLAVQANQRLTDEMIPYFPLSVYKNTGNL